MRHTGESVLTDLVISYHLLFRTLSNSMGHECPAALHSHLDHSVQIQIWSSVLQSARTKRLWWVNYLVIVSQLITLKDPAELICTDGSALAVIFLGLSIKQSAFIYMNSIGRRSLVFPSGIKVINSLTASKAILFNTRYIFVHIKTKIVEWIYVE